MVENPYVAAGSMSPLAVRVPSCPYAQCLCSPPTHQITNLIGRTKRLQLLALQIHSAGLGVSKQTHHSAFFSHFSFWEQ